MWGFPGSAVIKNLPTSAGDARDVDLIPWLGRFWSRKRQPTPVFLPGKYYGQRSLARYDGPCGHKESGIISTTNVENKTYGYQGVKGGDKLGRLGLTYTHYYI